MLNLELINPKYYHVVYAKFVSKHPTSIKLEFTEIYLVF